MGKFKVFYCLILAISLVGCSSSPTEEDKVFDSTEKIYIVSHNYVKLIDLYKEALQKEPNNIDILTKLVRAYLDSGDPESARFYLRSLFEEMTKEDPYIYYLDGLAYYQSEDFTAAIESLDKGAELAQYQSSNSKFEQLLTGDIFNLKGISYASLGNIEEARKNFVLAKKNFYNETKITNNLAMLDMLNGDYDLAYKKLIKLYYSTSSDDTTKANLAVCLAKLKKYEELKLLFKGDFDESSIFQLYLYLNSLERVQFSHDIGDS